MLRRPRRIIIDDSDCGPHLVIYMQPVEGSAVYPAAAIDELATAAPEPSIVSPAIVAASIASQPAPAASSPMHVYFQQFAGCQHGNMEPAPTTSPPDAPIMDLRSAVPPQGQIQFLDLECTHMPKDSDDSSGCTGAESSDDGSSFIDDEPAEYTVEDALYIATYLQKEMPLTAAQLLNETRVAAAAAVAIASSAPKRSRPIILSSDSDPDILLPLVRLSPDISNLTPQLPRHTSFHIVPSTLQSTPHASLLAPFVCRLTAGMLRAPLLPMRVCIDRQIVIMWIIMPSCARLEITLPNSFQIVSLTGVICTVSDARFAPHTWHCTPQDVGQGSRSKSRYVECGVWGVYSKEWVLWCEV
jgi:hypothetical protein